MNSAEEFCTRMERLADEATPGPWYEFDVLCSPGAEIESEQDAAHIAANDPPTVMAMLRVIRAAEGSMKIVRDPAVLDAPRLQLYGELRAALDALPTEAKR